MATYKQNDTVPSYICALRDNIEDAYVDLTFAESARFLMRETGTTGTPSIDGVVSILDAASGIVEYAWKAGDLDTAGLFQAEFEVTWLGGGVETFPNKDYNLITVVDDVG